MGRVWQAAWDNVHKEPLWRLSVNGVPNAGGHDIVLNHPCPCGWAGPADVGGRLSDQERAFGWRSHHFWSCPVAVAVVEEIRRSLPPPGVVTCANLWLLRPPAGVQDGVWGVVATAAIAAINSGRKNLVRLHLGQVNSIPPGQTLITAYLPTIAGTQPPTCLQRATHKAAAWFWALLQDFASLQTRMPEGWGSTLPSAHPFFGGGRSSGQFKLIVINK